MEHERRQFFDTESLSQGLRRSASLQAIALMAPFEVVVLHELVEVGLDLLDVLVPGGSAGDAEALVEHRPVHPFHEAVGTRRTDLGGAVFDPFHRSEQFVGVLLGSATELASVVSEDGPDRDAQFFVERQDTIVEQIAFGNRHLGVVDLGEGERAEDIDDDLHIDLADTFERTPVEGVLIKQFAGARGFDVTAAELGAVALQELDLRLAEHEGGIAGGLFQSQQALGSRFQIVSQPGTADAAGTDGDAHQAKFVGDVLGPVGGPFQ